MPTTFFLVRAVVAASLRSTFDHWTSAGHPSWVCRIFKRER